MQAELSPIPGKPFHSLQSEFPSLPSFFFILANHDNWKAGIKAGLSLGAAAATTLLCARGVNAGDAHGILWPQGILGALETTGKGFFNKHYDESSGAAVRQSLKKILRWSITVSTPGDVLSAAIAFHGLNLNPITADVVKRSILFALIKLVPKILEDIGLEISFENRAVQKKALTAASHILDRLPQAEDTLVGRLSLAMRDAGRETVTRLLSDGNAFVRASTQSIQKIRDTSRTLFGRIVDIAETPSRDPLVDGPFFSQPSESPDLES